MGVCCSAPGRGVEENSEPRNASEGAAVYTISDRIDVDLVHPDLLNAAEGETPRSERAVAAAVAADNEEVLHICVQCPRYLGVGDTFQVEVPAPWRRGDQVEALLDWDFLPATITSVSTTTTTLMYTVEWARAPGGPTVHYEAGIVPASDLRPDPTAPARPTHGHYQVTIPPNCTYPSYFTARVQAETRAGGRVHSQPEPEPEPEPESETGPESETEPQTRSERQAMTWNERLTVALDPSSRYRGSRVESVAVPIATPRGRSRSFAGTGRSTVESLRAVAQASVISSSRDASRFDVKREALRKYINDTIRPRVVEHSRRAALDEYHRLGRECANRTVCSPWQPVLQGTGGDISDHKLKSYSLCVCPELCHLTVNRQHLVEDTFRQVMSHVVRVQTDTLDIYGKSIRIKYLPHTVCYKDPSSSNVIRTRTKQFTVSDPVLDGYFITRALRRQIIVDFDGEDGIDEGGLTVDFYTSFVEKVLSVKDRADPNLVWRRHVINDSPLQVGMRVNVPSWEHSSETASRPAVIMEIQSGSVVVPDDIEPRQHDGEEGMLTRQKSTPQAELSHISIEATMATAIKSELEPMGFELDDDYVLQVVRAHNSEYEEIIEAILSGWESPAANQLEWRIDPKDGLAYTLDDFLIEYGGTAEWEAAQPAEWIGAEQPEIASVIECTFTEIGGLGVNFKKHASGRTVVVHISKGTQAEHHPQLKTGLFVQCIDGVDLTDLPYSTVGLMLDSQQRPLTIQFAAATEETLQASSAPEIGQPEPEPEPEPELEQQPRQDFSQFKIGDHVEVHGLKNVLGQQLNGQRGVIQSYSTRQGRYTVHFTCRQQTVTVSAVNLIAIPASIQTPESLMARVCFDASGANSDSRHKVARFAWVDLDILTTAMPAWNTTAGQTAPDIQGIGTEYWFKVAAEYDNEVSWSQPTNLPKELESASSEHEIPLFVHSAADDYTYRINPHSVYINGYERLFELFGIILAKAVVDDVQLPCRFTAAFYKSLLGLPFEMKDLENVDAEMYNSVQHVLDMPEGDVEHAMMVFAVGDTELEPGGMEREVDGTNREEWAQKMMAHCLGSQVKEQRNCIARGFSSVLPLRELKALGIDAHDFELILSGLPSYDVDDWKQHTVIRGTQLGSTVDYFWELMRDFSKEERAMVVRFVTGSAGIPPEGFKGLRGRQTRNEAATEWFKINLLRPVIADSCSRKCRALGACMCRLPQSHTCFNTLDLPPYDSKEMLREKLQMATTIGCVGFGLA